MQNFITALDIVAPVFFLIFIGFWLQRRQIINDNFNRTASKIVFQVALPALVFERIATTRFAEVFSIKLIAFGILIISGLFGLFSLFSGFCCKTGRDQGAFIQGSVRSNFAILGMALIYNAFGKTALSKAAIFLALILPFFNIYSVLALVLPLHKEESVSIWKTFVDIVKNPLIIAAFVALPFSVFHIPIHDIFTKTIGYLSNLTLPLALLAIGGQLTFQSMRDDFREAAWAGINKIILMPFIITFLAILFGFRGENLGVLFFLGAAPTAISSYPMADALGSNARLAGNIILITTVGAIFTVSAGIFILKTMGYF